MTRKILVGVILSVFVFSVSAFAYECDICKAANQKTSSDYLHYTGAKVLQGATNASLSWMEIGLKPTENWDKATKEAGGIPAMKNPIMDGFGGLATGLINGAGSACVRALQGAGQLVTALWPQRVMPAANCEVCNVETLKEQGVIS